ncbi:PHD finger protein 11 isoform 8 [Mus musculus]|uniref:Isoform 2 of PHD finger protein 11 n=4 Tax=Mus musculus TaxID=10090 RepID=A6H5X4-2|nr:PHD finger protein 11 isoform 8 [Mus musculus]EDL36138.1 mCG13856, isoform CRA_b [Mus musculus]
MAQETAPPCGPVSRGDSPIIEKMEKRTCALCPEGHEWSQIYFSPSGNIVAHENCLLYSSGLVECETLDLRNTIRNFDVKSVKKEIWRGRRLKCSFCNKGGATVGCDLWFCKKSYHYVCAKKDQAILQVDGNHGTYKLFCPEHSPEQEEATESADDPSMKKKRGKNKRLSSGPPAQPKTMKCSNAKRHMTEEPHGHTVIKSKACEWEERQRQMKQQLEALADLQQSLCSFQENGDLDCSSSTSGSLLPPEDHQVRSQESPEVQAGSGDSL